MSFPALYKLRQVANDLRVVVIEVSRSREVISVPERSPEKLDRDFGQGTE